MMRMPSCCVPVAEAALFVPVRSSARFFAASARHGFKTRAQRAVACNLYLLGVPALALAKC